MISDSIAPPKGRVLSVLLIEDHAIVRRGVKQIISETFPEAIFGEAANAEEARRELRKPSWSIIIIDISLPDANGLDLLKEARESHPGTPVLMFSMYPERQYAIRALRTGAAGYLTKDSGLEEMATAIRRVLSGGKYISSNLAERLAGQVYNPSNLLPHERLSTREYTIISGIATGKTIKEISSQLGISPKTVSTYRHRAFGKMQITTDADLVRYFQENGLL